MSLFLKSSLVGMLAVSLAACGGSNEGSDPEPTPPEKTETTQTSTPAASPSTPAETPTTPASTEAAGASEFADLPEPYKSADFARGKRVFRTCSSCHLLDPDAGNLVGPNLHGLFDRKAGELATFNFSKAMQDADFQWTAGELDQWLANPRTYLPGNNMSFSGVRREPDRVAVIAYLLTETAK